MQPKTLLKLSILAALATIALKTYAWWLTGSVGLLSDAMESFVNLASAVFALQMVIVAQRPADADHPYGHHKAEYFSSGFEGILIIGAAIGIVWATLDRLLHPEPLEQLGWGIALAVVSSAINGVLAWAMFRVAKVHRSIALEADARHLVADVWTSAGVVIGVGAVALTGWLWLDALAAIFVALNILREGLQLVWRSSQGLMDEALEPELLAQIHSTLAEFADAQPHSEPPEQHLHQGLPAADAAAPTHVGREPTIRFDHLVTRRSGQRRFADLHMHMPAHWTLGRAAAVRANVEQALMSAVPGLRASIQLLPSDAEAQAQLSDHLHGVFSAHAKGH